MFVFYRLFHRCIKTVSSHPPNSPLSESSVPSIPSHTEKERAIVVWFTAFGFSLLFRPVIELVIRFLVFSTCVLLIGTLDGALNLLIGHAVLRAAKYNGYDPPLLSSVAAGTVGGVLMVGPTILASACLIAILGGPKLRRALSAHITFLLELASLIAVSAAACSLGVTVLQRVHPGTLNDRPLDTTHAARAGALGACILTVPILSTAAFLMRDAQTTPAVWNKPATLDPSPRLVRNCAHVPRMTRSCLPTGCLAPSCFLFLAVGRSP